MGWKVGVVAVAVVVALCLTHTGGGEEPLPRPPVPALGEEPAECVAGEKLVPTCGVLWGVAPGAHTDQPRRQALADFERKTGRAQAVYHAYHRGDELFPTEEEVATARDKDSPRLLFLNWKPRGATWAEIARGDLDTYLDRLAQHIRTTFPEPFFFTVHHEPENDVREQPGSGYTARDYAAMFRHVVQRLRDQGANIVSTMVYMAYLKWTTKPWFEKLYPGDDVVDWVAWDVYARSGDFAEMMNERSAAHPDWPGFYNWAATRFPDKPLMLAEWGAWYTAGNPGHQASFFGTVGAQIRLFPRMKALVYFDTPRDQRGNDSRVDRTPGGLAAYRWLGTRPMFDVNVSRGGTGGAAPPSRSPSGSPAPR